LTKYIIYKILINKTTKAIALVGFEDSELQSLKVDERLLDWNNEKDQEIDVN
jgi:hypothetical protein